MKKNEKPYEKSYSSRGARNRCGISNCRRGKRSRSTKRLEKNVRKGKWIDLGCCL